MRLLTIASIILLTAACSDKGEFDLRMRSSDENYMSELAGALDAAGVDFRVRRDGSIAYRHNDEDKFRAIEERLKKDIAGGVYVKFELEEQKKQFLGLLDAGHRAYRVERKADGEWIRWHPSNEDEAREMTARALEKAIAMRASAKR